MGGKKHRYTLVKRPKIEKIVTVRFDDQKDVLRIEQLASAKQISKSAVIRDAVRFYADHHQRILARESEEPLVAEMRQLRNELNRLNFSVAQNIHLTGTILTEALPRDIRAMPKGEWKKVWNESRAFALTYLKRVSTTLRLEEEEAP